MLRKASGSMAGRWEFPGGKLENGESLRECLIREIREELGVLIVPGDYIGVSNYQNATNFIALHGFIVRQWSGELTLTEHDAMQWLAADALLSLSWCPADVPLVKAVIERYG